MAQVILDGVWVDAASVTPERHRFIGTFRPPTHMGGMGGYVMCPCGHVLKTVEQTRDHWADGHFDTPQYVTLDVTASSDSGTPARSR